MMKMIPSFQIKGICLLLFLFISSCINRKSALSSADTQWLNQNAEHIVIPFGYSAPPNAYYNDEGEYVGLLIDFKEEIEDKLKRNFRIKHFDTWNSLMEFSEKADNFIIIGIAQTLEREKYLNFTNSFIKIPYIIISRKDEEIATMEDLAGKTICITQGYAVNDYLKVNYPKLQVVEVENDLQGLRAISSGIYDVMITN